MIHDEVGKEKWVLNFFMNVLNLQELSLGYVLKLNAQVAELVDALVSGTSVSNDVQVRVLFWAQETAQRRKGLTAQRWK